MKAIFASRNRHKLEQVALLLPQFTLVPLDDVDPDLELQEPYSTFEENALSKARTVVHATKWPAIADDSGLEVDVLGGRPGVLSARFAGEGSTDRENNALLVQELTGIPEDLLTCRYRCVAAFVTPNLNEVTAEGACEGRIVLEPRGTMGFGYDPHVIPESETRTMAEIPLEEKLAFSHRGRAFRSLSEKLGAVR